MVRTRDILLSIVLLLLFWKLLGVAGVMIVCFALAYFYAKRKHRAAAAKEAEDETVATFIAHEEAPAEDEAPAAPEDRENEESEKAAPEEESAK